MVTSLGKGIFVLLLLSGCVTNNRGKVHDLAAFDLGCDKEKIKITPLQSGVYVGDPQYGAEGCGKRARYICTERHGCIKNSETTK